MKQPESAAFNYPFDFAFFAHVTPRRFPQKPLAEILTAPGSLSVTALFVYLLVAGTAQAHKV